MIKILGFKKLPKKLREGPVSEQERWERILGTGLLWPKCPFCKTRIQDATIDIKMGIGVPYSPSPNSSIVINSNWPNIHVMLECCECHSRIEGYSEKFYLENENIILGPLKIFKIIKKEGIKTSLDKE